MVTRHCPFSPKLINFAPVFPARYRTVKTCWKCGRNRVQSIWVRFLLMLTFLHCQIKLSQPILTSFDLTVCFVVCLNCWLLFYAPTAASSAATYTFSCCRFPSHICWIRENNWFYTKDKFVAGLKAPAKLYALNLRSKLLLADYWFRFFISHRLYRKRVIRWFTKQVLYVQFKKLSVISKMVQQNGFCACLSYGISLFFRYYQGYS